MDAHHGTVLLYTTLNQLQRILTDTSTLARAESVQAADLSADSSSLKDILMAVSRAAEDEASETVKGVVVVRCKVVVGGGDRPSSGKLTLLRKALLT